MSRFWTALFSAFAQKRHGRAPCLSARTGSCCARVHGTNGVLALFVWLALFSRSQAEQEPQPWEGTKPARIVTRYALTSTHDLSMHDPKIWRLLASNNEGQSWDVLDVRTNEEFTARQQRRIFRISNRNPYNIYRLEVSETQAKGMDPFDDNKNVQLADLELMGPTVGLGEGKELQCIATASEAHPLLGPAENAFDNDPETHWMDLGIYHGKTSWVQCQYATDRELLLTNLAQVQAVGRVAGQNEALRAHGAAILSDLAGKTATLKLSLSGYALVSANDAPGRDPRDWSLLGSNDGGKSWQTLDVRSHELFASRFQRRVFEITNHLACALFRLQITATRQSDNMVQLAEIEPLYSSGEPVERSLIVSAKTDNPPAEGTDMAFDADPKTKWLSMVSPTRQNPNWVQWQYIPAQPGLPVVDRHSLERLGDELELNWLRSHPDAPPQALTGYALTSANDYPTRDPRDWQLLGSNDGGETWVTLDEQRNQIFPQRFQRKAFTLKTAARYSRYQLRITAVADPVNARSVQLAELEALCGQTNAGYGYSVVTTSQAENPPEETSDLLFDGNPATKWLDFAEATTNRASWVEWHYVPWRGRRAINLDRLTLAASPTRRNTRLDLAGVVVAFDPASGLLGLLDQTGFQMFAAPPNSRPLQPGDRARIKGELLAREALPVLVRPTIQRLGLVPPADDNITSASQQEFTIGKISGRVVATVRGKFFTTLVLLTQGEDRRVMARIFDPSGMPLEALWNTQIRVQGLFEPVFAQDGELVPGVVWVSKPQQIELDPPNPAAWNSIPEYSLSSLLQTNPQPQVVRIRGNLIGPAEKGELMLAEGTRRVQLSLAQPIPPGEEPEVECVGLLTKFGAKPLLQFARLRRPQDSWPARPSTRARSSPGPQELAGIKGILDYAQTHPREDFPVKVRGVITYVDLDYGNFYLADGTGSIDVSSQFGAGVSPQQREEGFYVELKGTFHDGRLFASEFITVLGRGQMPKPLAHPIEYLMTGRDDGQWVEVEGVVSLAEKQRLTITARGGDVTAWVNDLGQSERDRLLGSVVRAQGVCSPAFNDRSQRLGQRLLVPSCEYIQILQPAPKDRFSIPALTIESLLETDADGNLSRTGLVKIAGILTHARADAWFVQDAKGGLRIVPQQDPNLPVGSRVEVVGLVRRDGLSVQLVQAQLRRIGQAPLPAAQRLDPAGEDTRGTEEDLDGMRVQMEGVLVGYGGKDSGQALHLELDHTRRTLYAFLSDTNQPLSTFRIGSRLRVEGPYKARTELGPDLNQTISGFEMYLNQPADVVILAQPAWWTPSRFLLAFLLISALSGVALAWTWTIARKNKLLQQARDELQVAHQKLERRVEERTQELAYERDLLNSLLDNLPDLIYFKDLQSRFVRVSRSKLQCVSDLVRGRSGQNGNGHGLENGPPNGPPSGVRSSRLTLSEVEAGRNFLIGKTDFDFYPEERARAAFKDEQEIIRTGLPLVGKLEQNWGKNGEVLWLLTTKMPWRDPAGNIIGTFGTSKDVTAIKEAEAKLSSLHQQLLQASRQAGMAEVATSVLHNVGNVLNSVNVSSGVISEQMRNSPMRRVGKLAELLEGHRDDLVGFLTRDNRGAHLVAYVRNLAQQLASEQTKMLSELGGLSSNIDHIKDIVARQQSYAKTSGLLEMQSIQDLVDDALRIHATALARQPIRVLREFNMVPPTLTDKHRVLQILVNLIGNAAQAMASNQSRIPTLTVQVGPRDEQWISVSVCDNGVGIPAENLTRIFSHGFTTKKDGHGFGLHSGALAARELGGSLRVHSGGLDQGATFILELPLRPANGSTAKKDPCVPALVGA